MINFEKDIFKNYQLIKEHLLDDGFIYTNNQYFKIIPLLNNEFTVHIFIKDNGEIKGEIFDHDFNDEYILFRNEKNRGEFIGEIREEFKKILINIRDLHYKRVLFNDNQALRLVDYIKEKYHEEVEFLWEAYPSIGIVRHKENNKWYCLISDIEENKLGKGVSYRHILNLKLKKEDIEELLKIDNIFPAWHMNKKSWITISLSDYFEDKFIFELLDKSYQETLDK